MKRLTAVIEFSDNNLSAYIKEVDGVIGIGDTIEEVKASLEESTRLCVEVGKELGEPVPEALLGDYEITYCFDMKSFLNVYCGILSKSGLEQLTGINQKQLWHYASGTRKPRKETIDKVADAVHGFAKELLSIEFV